MRSDEHSPEAHALMERLREQAEARGYHLNPDTDFVLDLMEGLLTNEARYGYPSCPCMEADGERTADLDILCPCDYRDADLAEYGTCYCGLYVSAEVARGERPAEPIPLRRPDDPAERPQARRPDRAPAGRSVRSHLLEAPIPVWRCSACGYLASRDQPPLECPVCQATADRFAPLTETKTPIWRCTVCGYLAAREEPPAECPVCWASQDRFELLD